MLITTLIAVADYATMPCCKEGGRKPEGRETEGSEAGSRGAGDRGAEAGRQRAEWRVALEQVAVEASNLKSQSLRTGNVKKRCAGVVCVYMLTAQAWARWGNAAEISVVCLVHAGAFNTFV